MSTPMLPYPALFYIGTGAAIPNVPARDLTEDDLAACAALDSALTADALVASGLYRAPKGIPAIVGDDGPELVFLPPEAKVQGETPTDPTPNTPDTTS